MKLEGKIINFLGDSITEGHGTTAPDKAFHQIIKEKYQLSYAYNYGVGGTRIARQIVPTKEATRWDYTFELRAEIMDKKADAIVVFGGTNDYGHGDAPFGKIGDTDIYTFCGAVQSLISKLKNDFPKADLIFMTPIHRLNESAPSPASGEILEAYAEAISEICKKNGVYVIDLFSLNPIDPADESLVPDGLHPNDAGHAIMAHVIGEALLNL